MPGPGQHGAIEAANRTGAEETNLHLRARETITLTFSSCTVEGILS
jgi:hypothetical protein